MEFIGIIRGAVMRIIRRFDKAGNPDEVAMPGHRLDAVTGVGAESANSKQILTIKDAYAHTGLAFPAWKKWFIVLAVCVVQCSTTFNASIYFNAMAGMQEEFEVADHTTIRLGQFLFYLMHGLGCALWAPLSEEFGRKWVLQISLLSVNLLQIPCVMAGSFGKMLLYRSLAGLSSAGGAIAFGTIADLFEPGNHQYAMALTILAILTGPVTALAFGSWSTTYIHWRWLFWISCGFGILAQMIHAFVPETLPGVLLGRRAKRLRKTGENINAYGPHEVRGRLRQRVCSRYLLKLVLRPFQILLTEPLVGSLSLLSGLHAAVIFIVLDSFPLVLAQWSFTAIEVGLAFLSLLFGYGLACASYLSLCPRYRRQHGSRVLSITFERGWILFLIPLGVIGIFCYAWTSLGPDHLGASGTLVFTVAIGIGNFAVYTASIDYILAVYGPFTASAAAGHGFSRNVLTGFATLCARPLYSSMLSGSQWQLVIPILLLSFVAALVCVPMWILYRNGEDLRKRSPLAQRLEREWEEQRST